MFFVYNRNYILYIKRAFQLEILFRYAFGVERTLIHVN